MLVFLSIFLLLLCSFFACIFAAMVLYPAYCMFFDWAVGDWGFGSSPHGLTANLINT